MSLEMERSETGDSALPPHPLMAYRVQVVAAFAISLNFVLNHEVTFPGMIHPRTACGAYRSRPFVKVTS
jgi:hypothetical protein